MEYYADSHLQTVKDVETFFRHLVFERKVNFHPDDVFESYVNTETKEPSFSSPQCDVYNRLMDESFEVCDKEGVDIYEIGLNELQKVLWKI